MKKPRGRTGFARATGARELSFPEANFPRTKADIETWIVKCFFSSIKENGWEPFCLANPRQNEEQDFDYTVDSARGEGFLELVEAGPVEVYRGDYAKAPVVTKSSDVVKNLLEKIKNKSEIPRGSKVSVVFVDLHHPMEFRFERRASLLATVRT
jgi:hypothetical protein